MTVLYFIIREATALAGIPTVDPEEVGVSSERFVLFEASLISTYVQVRQHVERKLREKATKEAKKRLKKVELENAR